LGLPLRYIRFQEDIHWDNNVSAISCIDNHPCCQQPFHVRSLGAFGLQLFRRTFCAFSDSHGKNFWNQSWKLAVQHVVHRNRSATDWLHGSFILFISKAEVKSLLRDVYRSCWSHTNFCHNPLLLLGKSSEEVKTSSLKGNRVAATDTS